MRRERQGFACRAGPGHDAGLAHAVTFHPVRNGTKRRQRLLTGRQERGDSAERRARGRGSCGVTRGRPGGTPAAPQHCPVGAYGRQKADRKARAAAASGGGAGLIGD